MYVISVTTLKKSSILFVLLLVVLAPFQTQIALSEDSTSLSQNIEDHTTLGLNVRLRDEYWNTFERQGTDSDDSYNFFLIRARASADFTWDNFKIHLLTQGVKAFDFPENGAFGPGVIYRNASDLKTGPGNFQFVEALLEYNDPSGFYFMGGRIPIREGTEVTYKESPKLTWVIKKRLSERLIGTWDWTNIGRRFDGASLGYQNSAFNFNAFGSWVTYGGFDFEDGYWKDLDNVVVVGGSATLKEGVVLDNTQLKLFNYFYLDNRDVAKSFAGDNLEINTIGISAVGAYPAGPGEIDLMLWLAFQFGNFGERNQKAVAFIGEAGYEFTQVPWKPWIRLGLAYASGDGDPNDSDNGTFFNMVPTNHKFYGYVDANAFSNLIDTYMQFFLTPHERVKLAFDGHLFWLASDDEVWIGGSGPFNDSVFGYAYRSPLQGNSIDKTLGGEIDISANIAALDFLSFQVGYSRYFGEDGVSAVFDKEDDLNWFYAQCVFNFQSK